MVQTRGLSNIECAAKQMDREHLGQGGGRKSPGIHVTKWSTSLVWWSGQPIDIPSKSSIRLGNPDELRDEVTGAKYDNVNQSQYPDSQHGCLAM